MPVAALIMGYGGLIPFVILSLCLVAGIGIVGFDLARTGQLLMSYAAIILSFIGAVHWGVALAHHDSMPTSLLHRFYGYSVLPAICAWVSLLLPTQVGLIVISVLFWLAFWVDHALLFERLNVNYGTFRLHLTFIVSSALALAGVFGTH
ncbi:MAG: Unknown protein [uncultured Thiotrichaceae bacterium]|uniref:DUF3429 domain-containing protein n=1 Tax=uncultured Thiotrichaceae bacterium TaxID=298394 RepID=A0A6S6TXZ3_9GAMM|nr:MAG: Unknown protein [uncultured Thiotrichaceae bacterium]